MTHDTSPETAIAPQPWPHLLHAQPACHQDAVPVAFLNTADRQGVLYLGIDDNERQMQLCVNIQASEHLDEGRLAIFNLPEVLRLPLNGKARAAICAIMALWHLRESPNAGHMLTLFQAMNEPGVTDELYVHLFNPSPAPERDHA